MLESSCNRKGNTQGGLQNDSQSATQKWLDAMRSGDAGAFRHLYSFIRGSILPALPLAPGVNRDDVLADTASEVWLSIQSLRDDSKLLSFVATIARRIASRRRRECARFASLPQEAVLPGETSCESAKVECDETLERLSGALRRSDQQLFRLLYVVGASSDEAQAALNVSPEILRKRKHRLHVRLRNAVARRADGSAEN